MHHDPVRQAGAADGHAQAGAQQGFRQALAAMHPPRRPALGDHLLDRRRVKERDVGLSAAVEWQPEAVPLPGLLGRRNEGKFKWRAVGVALRRRAGRLDRGRLLPQAHHRDRHLVHPVRPDQRRHRHVGEPEVGRGGGPTVTSAWSSGSYQCTPAGSGPPCATATYSSSGNRPPADPAARNSQFPNGRGEMRTTPADRYSSRESCARSSRPGATSAAPASKASAGAA